jgi:plastocyanin
MLFALLSTALAIPHENGDKDAVNFDVTVRFTPPTAQTPPKLEYVPSLLRIKEGDSVTWHFNGFNHSVTQSDTDDCSVKKNGFNSGLLTTSYTRRFKKEGTFYYNCQAPFHCGLGMKGKIIVSDDRYHDVTVQFTPPTNVTPPKLEYVPALLNIKQGDYVSWHFNGFNHTVTQSETDDCSVKPDGFNSGLLTTGYERRFKKKGTFFYNCQAPFHCGLGMKGKIVVLDD